MVTRTCSLNELCKQKPFCVGPSNPLTMRVLEADDAITRTAYSHNNVAVFPCTHNTQNWLFVSKLSPATERAKSPRRNWRTSSRFAMFHNPHFSTHLLFYPSDHVSAPVRSRDSAFMLLASLDLSTAQFHLWSGFTQPEIAHCLHDWTNRSLFEASNQQPNGMKFHPCMRGQLCQRQQTSQ